MATIYLCPNGHRIGGDPVADGRCPVITIVCAQCGFAGGEAHLAQGHKFRASQETPEPCGEALVAHDACQRCGQTVIEGHDDDDHVFRKEAR